MQRSTQSPAKRDALSKKYSALRWGVLILACMSFTITALQDKKPTFYIIGDSTVKNGKGKGDGNLWGWGNFLGDYFDTIKISVSNHALGGRSSRTFITEGHWGEVLSQLKPGDLVIMQFGHNDGGPLDDTARARGTIKGTGDESKDIYNPIMKKAETVHSYGWYMRQYVTDIKSKGAIAIICSPIPRNVWVDGKCARASNDYGKWAEETARTTGAYFIDLNGIIADQYDQLGPDKVKDFFPGDHTHTNEAGARLNAKAVVTGLRKIPSTPVAAYLLPANN
jgi:lysophospholipase L1-like esterase